MIRRHRADARLSLIAATVATRSPEALAEIVRISEAERDG